MMKYIILITLLCGAALARDEKIIGGQPATEQQFPYFVSFRDEIGSEYEAFCGGSIIGHETIMTSASCVDSFAQLGLTFGQITVVAGSITLNVSATEQRVSIIDVKKYELWDDQKVDYDIALIHVAPAFEFNADVNRVSGLETRSVIPEGEITTIPGFGVTAVGGDFSENLRLVHLLAMADDTCHREFPQEVRDHTFCAGDNPQNDPCLGDNGGPLICHLTNYQCGIASHKISCDDLGLPGAYTRVSFFVNWIIENTWG